MVEPQNDHGGPKVIITTSKQSPNPVNVCLLINWSHLFPVSSVKTKVPSFTNDTKWQLSLSTISAVSLSSTFKNQPQVPKHFLLKERLKLTQPHSAL
jgi:hypothetical protein